jgi:hypothetical protein
MSHTTTQPAQVQTDTVGVFRSMEYKQNMELIGYVDVPRYSRPDQHGVELDRDKQLSLAVARAVECTDSFIESLYDPGAEVGPDDYSAIETERCEHSEYRSVRRPTVDVGEEFWVSTEIGNMIPVEYTQNPTFDVTVSSSTDQDGDAQ